MEENIFNNDYISKKNNYWETIKGSFTPEQFGVFLNMPLSAIKENYLVRFHECFHYWQSIFTPYGHLKWGCYRTVSSEVIELWIEATKADPSERVIPIGSVVPCKSVELYRNVAKIFVQDYASKIVSFVERACNDEVMKDILPISIDKMCPVIKIQGEDYRLNGIDIIESFAKFQEASLAYIIEDKPFISTINIKHLKPEYYSALYYFIDKIGWERIIEFPVLCELALSTNEYCKFDDKYDWKRNHPAWRFVRMIDLLLTDNNVYQLKLENIKNDFVIYSEYILKNCGYESQFNFWKSAINYASEENGLSIPKDMLKAINLKKEFPWILSFPFADLNIAIEMQKFQPYFYITSDSTIYSVDNESLGNEVIFENQYQAFSHQIRGNMSLRCLDRNKLQCGFSYYGLNYCKYQKNGDCDGHIDRFTQLPKTKLDHDGTIIDGCSFEIFLSLMNISIKDIKVTNINTKINHNDLAENAKNLLKSQDSNIE